MELDHTFVWSSNMDESSKFVAGMLGLTVESVYNEPALRVNTYLRILYTKHDDFKGKKHFAFFVSDKEFDDIHQRFVETGTAFGPNPGKMNMETNNYYGGRGLYFICPDDHIWEVCTATTPAG